MSTPTLDIARPVPARSTGSTVRLRPVPRLEPLSDAELRAAGIEPPPLDPPPFDAPVLPFDLPGGRAGRLRRPGRVGTGRPGPAVLSSAAAMDSSARGWWPTGTSPQGLAAAGGAAPGIILAGDAAVEETTVASPALGAVTRLLGVIFEVADGFRPVAQVRGLCRPDRYDEICVQVTGRSPRNPGLRTRRGGFVPAHALTGGGRTPVASRPPTGAPPRAGRLDSRGPASRLGVRHLRICDVSADAAEVSAVLGRGSVVWAVAARMELIGDRWLCCYLEVV